MRPSSGPGRPARRTRRTKSVHLRVDQHQDGVRADTEPPLGRATGRRSEHGCGCRPHVTFSYDRCPRGGVDERGHGAVETSDAEVDRLYVPRPLLPARRWSTVGRHVGEHALADRRPISGSPCGARATGVNLRSAPCSWTSSSRSRKYCGQPSAASRTPRARSSRTYDATSALLTFATAARAPARPSSNAATASEVAVLISPTATSSASRLRDSASSPGSVRPSARSEQVVERGQREPSGVLSERLVPAVQQRDAVGKRAGPHVRVAPPDCARDPVGRDRQHGEVGPVRVIAASCAST